jgi:hypothetical protein
LAGHASALETADEHLQLILGLTAAESLLAASGAGGNRLLHQAAAGLARFGLQDFAGDPVPALAAHAVLAGQGVRIPALAALAGHFTEALSDGARRPLPAALALPRALLRQAGSAVPDVVFRKPAWPSAYRVVASRRSQLLTFCHNLGCRTAWGLHRMRAGQLDAVLPYLAVSYARDWDIDMVCMLLRACAYLGVAGHAGTGWAVQWLLDQQQPNGAFGLLAPEARLVGYAGAEWRLYFQPTVIAVWALAETRAPGFFWGMD